MKNRNTRTLDTSVNPEFRQFIYDLVNGNIDLESVHQTNPLYVEDEFAEGKICARLYDEVCIIRHRLFERLDSDDDRDVERLTDILLEIGRHLSFKMFDYGWFFAMNERKLAER